MIIKLNDKSCLTLKLRLSTLPLPFVHDNALTVWQDYKETLSMHQLYSIAYL